jgi:outer membrane protein
MRFIRGAAAVLSGLGLAASAMAQAPEASSKIGFVEVERAVAGSDEGKARLKDLESWAKPLQDELAKLGKEINDLGTDMNSKRGIATDDALAEMNKQLVAKQRTFEDKQRVAKRDFEARQNAVLKDLGGKLQEIVGTYAKDNGYTAVFILKPNDLIYLAPGADLTDIVIKLYNQKYPFPGGATGAK